MDHGDDNDMNMTRLDDDDDSKLDINSVLSGNIDDDDDDNNCEDDYYGNGNNLEGVFGKNLGALFDDNAGKEEEPQQRHLNNNNIAKSVTTTSNGSGNPSRPPLAPGSRSLSNNVSGSFKSSNDNNTNNNGKQQRVATSNNNNNGGDDKRLSVFLRVRPPVCANGKKGNEGSINTIEVIDGPGSGGSSSSTLPTTIRTYPPLNSNAAKVVRGNSTNKHHTNKKNDASNKSLIDDASSVDSGTILDPNAEIRGVKEFEYSGVFGPNSTQCEVYDNVAAPLVEGLFPKNNNGGGGDDVVNSLGESALLFTLGVTNAGKTHTVMGSGFETSGKGKNKMIASMTNNNNKNVPNENWGIIPRSLDHMLSRVNSINATAATRNGGGGQQLQMYMSYLEIYNEQIFDLLPGKSDVPRRPCDGPPTLKLRESRRGRIFVRGLARHAVNNVQQGLELAQMAKKNRHTASNNINTESSRSHSICQLEITHSPVVNNGSVGGGKRTGDMDVDSEYETDDDSSVCSRSSSGSRNTAGNGRQRKSTIIWIVDLAGSERSKKTRSHTRHQKEAALINASLMNLMRCLREMLNHQPKKRGATSKGGGVVPFRESKLTHMFMNHLTGPAASRTSMIVNVNPAADDYDETQHVLSYAAAAKQVKISAVDYNRKRRLFAKESNVKTSSTRSPKKALLATIVKKISPKKRKGTADSSSKPQAKRLRSDNHSTSALGKKFARTGVARKPPPSKTTSAKSTTAGNDDELLEKLREENFDLKVTVDDLRQQLEDCENEVREEVVATLSEQMQESKMWYESRIAKLQEEINNLQSSQQKQLNAENDKADLHETIVECEEEMKRMREDHDVEVKELESMSLQLTNEHQTMVDKLTMEHDKELRAEQLKNKRLEDELGTLRHQARELQVGHESLFSRYNALLAQQSEQRQASNDNENPTDAERMQESPSFTKLPRERVSDVASTSSCVDIVSPSKKKRGGKWFVRSPAKVAIGGGGKKMSPVRSPLGNVNKK